MTLIIKILSIVGIVLLVVLALLVCVVVFPRKFWIEYTVAESLTVRMNLFVFKIRLYPFPKIIGKLISKKKSEPVTPDKKIEEKPDETEKPSQFDNIQLSFELIQQVLRGAKGVIKRILKSFKFSDISFTLPITGKDAFDTQQKYANITTAFYGLNTFLQRYVRIYYNRPIFVADFANQHKNSTYFYMKITASPLLLIFAGVYAFKQYRLIMKNNTKDKTARKKEI